MKIQIPQPVNIKIDEIKVNPNNVKHHSKQQIHDIAELMKMVGFKDPIVIDRNNVIWAGHGRLESAKLLEMTEVPCVYLDKLSETTKKIFMIMDNKVNESFWISENVKSIIDDIGQSKFEKFELSFDEWFDSDNDSIESEYTNMPDFDNDDLEPFKKLTVKFQTEKDLKNFLILIKQDITDQTRWIWYPKKEKSIDKDKQWQ